MKTLKELADIGAAAALQELTKTTRLNFCMWINKTVAGEEVWNDEALARQAFAAAVRHAVLTDLVTKSDSSPIFEAHGFTWFKHTPGEPMPCDGEALVNWLTRPEADGEPYKDTLAKADLLSWDSPVGWRYAEPTPPVTKTVPLTMDDIRATDEFKRHNSNDIRTAQSWSQGHIWLANNAAISYATLSKVYLRRQHGSDEWKPCNKEEVK